MKTISELQNEIRGIKKDLAELNTRLDNIDNGLSDYKDTSNAVSKNSGIYDLAKTFPKIEHPILKENVTVKNNYFSMLLMISTTDDSINDEQLLFLQRITLADEHNSRLDDYLSRLGSIDFRNAIFQLNETVKQKYPKQLLLDMIILSYLSKNTERKSYEVIASFSSFLNLTKYEVLKITKVAKTILLNDITLLNDSNDAKFFAYYLREVPGYKKYLHKDMMETINRFHGAFGADEFDPFPYVDTWGANDVY